MRIKPRLPLFIFGLITLLSFHASGQSVTEQEALTRAQTEYYRAQTSKLTQRASFWQSLKDSPASAIGILGALVALISFAFNYRVTLKHQRDTQFFEALKRFGDKESSTVRLSAAVLISQIAATRQGRGYLGTALDQLVGGIQLEKSPVVLKSIAISMARLADSKPKVVISKIYELNFALEEELIINLAMYLQVLRKHAGVSDLTNAEVDPDFWSKAIIVTRIPNEQLDLWIQANLQTFYRTLLSTGQRLDSLNDERLMKYLTSFEGALELSAERLRLNDVIFGDVYLGMFLPYDARQKHRESMDRFLENFLLQRAAKRGYETIPTHWSDLHKGRPSLRAALN